MYPYNANLGGNSRALRRNMTDEEKKLWYSLLKKLPFAAKRQKIIGNYIVDFYIPQVKTVIEVDGIHHESRENRALDIDRDEYLQSLGIRVLRYPNDAINNRFNEIANDILEKLGVCVSDLKL